jgi:hypothetical protein
MHHIHTDMVGHCTNISLTVYIYGPKGVVPVINPRFRVAGSARLSRISRKRWRPYTSVVLKLYKKALEMQLDKPMTSDDVTRQGRLGPCWPPVGVLIS